MRIVRLLAALGGLLGVGVGAFGAHGVSDPQAKAWIATGATYGLVHAVAALWASERALTAAWLLTLGSLLFAGSLYAMGLGAPRWLGMTAPVGGLLMLAGWALLIVAEVRRR